MDSNRTQPLYIENGLTEVFSDQCSFDENSCEWQDLEQFWGEEKHRLQELDGQEKPLSSSYEEHLLHDDFLDEPRTKSNSLSLGEDFRTIRDHISDVPTTYIVRGFKPHELIAFGTYVDKHIIPGFRYRVRKNLTEEYLFEGKAKYLESIGMGYGKRITFECDTLNENENYFWSDSADQGYGFTLQAVSKDDVFSIFDTNTGYVAGRVLVNNPSLKNDAILSITVGERGYVEIEVEVKLNCDVILKDSTSKQNIFVNDVTVQGKAIVTRENLSSKAKVNQIFLDDFIIESCILVNEE